MKRHAQITTRKFSYRIEQGIRIPVHDAQIVVRDGQKGLPVARKADRLDRLLEAGRTATRRVVSKKERVILVTQAYLEILE